jgi:hypothetical protein
MIDHFSIDIKTTKQHIAHKRINHLHPHKIPHKPTLNFIFLLELYCW